MLVKVKNYKIVSALSALQALDAADEKGKRLYKFDNVKFRLSLARKMRRLADIRKDIEDERTKMAKDLRLNGDANDEPANLIVFKNKVQELMEADCDIDIGPITIVDLQLERNDISSGILADLDWLIAEDGKEPA